ncbi:MAG: hypothetical protein FJY10_09215 [Bacteroidetes bacterium]|nr:hypothetical protein [Bacteroidota bacterium]
MAFNSSLFLLYFLPPFLVIYWLLPRHFRNHFLLLSGVVFYSWGAPGFLLILAASVILDYILLREMQRHAGRVRFLIFMHLVILNVGLLLYYKYMNFFIGQVSEVGMLFGSWPIRWTEIIMPVGISFITFQKLSCAIDVYRKHFPGFKSWHDYALYLFMFPQMLAGPIVRPGQLADQIADRRATSSIDHKLTGFYRFAIGLAKKVLVADVLGVTVNAIFALDPDQLSTGLAWRRLDVHRLGRLPWYIPDHRPAGSFTLSEETRQTVGSAAHLLHPHPGLGALSFRLLFLGVSVPGKDVLL